MGGGKQLKNSNDGAIVAKIKSIYGKRIQKSQLIELSNCKNVNSIAAYLKANTNYSKILETIDENTVHRGQLESILKQQNFNNYEKIYYYLSKNNLLIFKLIIEEFEMIEILKMILLLNANNTKEYIINLPTYLISKCNVDLLKLAKIKTYEELLNILKHTHYHKILKKLKPSEENQKIDYFTCEHNLFEQFFERMFETIRKGVKKSERKELENLMKLRIDHINICRIYRLKFLLNESAEKIGKLIFKFHKILNKEKIDNLINSTTNKEFGQKFEKFFHISETSKTLRNQFEKRNFYIENFMAKLDYKICKRLIHISNNFSVVFCAFHKLSQIEISNLIYAIEGVRYGVMAKEIQELYVI